MTFKKRRIKDISENLEPELLEQDKRGRKGTKEKKVDDNEFIFFYMDEYSEMVADYYETMFN